jgi:hypothetical protein
MGEGMFENRRVISNLKDEISKTQIKSITLVYSLDYILFEEILIV